MPSAGDLVDLRSHIEQMRTLFDQRLAEFDILRQQAATVLRIVRRQPMSQFEQEVLNGVCDGEQRVDAPPLFRLSADNLAELQRHVKHVCQSFILCIPSPS